MRLREEGIRDVGPRTYVELGGVENVAPVRAPARGHQPGRALVDSAVPLRLLQGPYLHVQHTRVQNRDGSAHGPRQTQLTTRGILPNFS